MPSVVQVMAAAALLGLLSGYGCGGEPASVEAASVEPAVLFSSDVPYAEQDEATRLRVARMEGYFPNTTLTTHEGESVQFYDDLLRDKTVLFNFMYTRCDGT